MYTLIIADDEFELRQALIHTVDWESIGFRVIGEAENGVEALELVEKLQPDLLLTDIKMPFLSGIELAREVRAIRPAMNIAFLSGYDDFAYAQQAIQYNIISYILKPISANELVIEMTKIKEKMDLKVEELTKYRKPEDSFEKMKEYDRGFFLYSLLMEEYDGDNSDRLQEIQEAGIRNGIIVEEMEHSCFLVQVVEFLDENGNNYTNIEHTNLVNAIVDKYARCISVFSNHRVISLISSSERDLKRYMTVFPKEISQSAKRYMNQDTMIGVSNLFTELLQTKYGYLEAIDAKEYAENEETGIGFLSDYEGIEVTKQLHAGTVIDELIRIIKTESEETIKEYINEIFIQERAESGLITSQMVVAIYETVLNIAGQNAADEIYSGALETDEQIRRMLKKQSKAELTALALAARNVVFDKRKANTEIICDEVMKIIDEEYGDEQLTLAEVSERLHVSISYLSTLVKKISGKSFITLLTEKRMVAAKEQLLYSQKKILEIAMDCGYSDNHYFSYSFKKYFGISPRKMRESIANEEK